MRALLFSLKATVLALILAPLALALVLVPTDPPLPNAAVIGPPPPPAIPFPEYQECIHWIEKTDGPKAWIDEWYRREKTALPALDASTVGLLGSPLGPGPLLAASALIPGRPEKTDGAAINIVVRAPGGRASIYKFDFVEGHLKLLVWRGPEGQRRLVPPGGALWPSHYIFRH